MLRYKTKLDVV